MIINFGMKIFFSSIIIIFFQQIQKRAAFFMLLKLYNCENNTVDTYLLDENSNLTSFPYFCTNCTSYMILHGFRDSVGSKWVSQIAENLFIDSVNKNIFLIDWSDVSITSSVFGYETAVRDMNITIREIQKLLQPFLKNGFFQIENSTVDIHCIGHSLGNISISSKLFDLLIYFKLI